MGDPKKNRKKYTTPAKPWEKDRIDEERALTKEYGFKNKKELWKMRSTWKNFLFQSKRLTADNSEQSQREKKLLLERLSNLGLTQEAATIADVLDLQFKEVLERRLQTVVFRKGLSRSMNQARQFITHEHILVGDKKITSPSFLVPQTIEASVSFVAVSSLAAEDHPERTILEKKAKAMEQDVVGDGTEEKPAEEKAEEKKLHR